MKSLQEYIKEGILDNVNTALKNADKNIKYNYFPKTKEERKDIVYKRMKERGRYANLNDIYTGDITDMSYLFDDSSFNGDISNWDVSNVTDMNHMFDWSDFDKNISDWKINKNCDTEDMFARCSIREQYKPKVIE